AAAISDIQSQGHADAVCASGRANEHLGAWVRGRSPPGQRSQRDRLRPDIDGKGSVDILTNIMSKDAGVAVSEASIGLEVRRNTRGHACGVGNVHALRIREGRTGISKGQ